MKRIAIYEPDISIREHKYLSDCIKNGWISSRGPYVKRFEQAFSQSINTRYALATSSGTAALHLALLGLGIEKDYEVIIPDLTFVATANAVSYLGARPVLVDITRNSWTIDPEQVLSKVTKQTKAIIVVHLYGHPADMNPLRQIARKHNLYIIEDAAEAFGTRYRGKVVGGLGNIGCFSFFANKTVTTGEGGMVTLNNKKLYNHISFLNNHSMSKKKRYYHPKVGYNYRMSSLQAAVGLAQIERSKQLIAKKRKIALQYTTLLKDLEEFITFPTEQPWAFCTYWMYSVVLKPLRKKNIRNRLMKFLESFNIESRPFFTALHKLPMYRQDGQFPISTMLSANGLSLPSGTTLRTSDIAFVCKAIHSFFRQQ